MAEDGYIHQKLDSLTETVNRLSADFTNYMQHGGKPLKKSSDDDRTVDFSKDENEERGNWTGRLDFLLACLGYAVGLGNVWRFPYLVYTNGGAVFFIPYVIMLAIVGMPIFLLELALGQYTSSGPFTCWKMAPIFTGIGVGMWIVSFIVGIYYNMIIAWSIFYLFASFTSELPWSSCQEPWASQYCGIVPTQNCTSGNWTDNGSGACLDVNGTIRAIYDAKSANITPRLPSDDYLTEYVLGDSKSIDVIGTPRWQLVLCLILAWVIVCLSLIKGVKSSGKVVYFTALFPYVVLVILFIRGLTLEGHFEGIRFYILEADFDRLKDAKVWKDAAVQIFFSLSASWGGLIALSSYNRFHNDLLRDSLIVSLGNCLTSFFAGFVIFSFLGYQATKLGVPVEDVAADGVTLAFTVYADAVTSLPAAPFWAILFFLMLITLGLDSEFALVETVTTSLMDQWPRLRKRKWAVILVSSIIMFLLGLPLTCPGGRHVLKMMDNYAGGWNVLVISLLECLCIAYVYGAFRFKNDIGVMIGKKGCGCLNWNLCSYWWMLCWAILTPAAVTFILVFSWVDYERTKYGDDSYFPIWADAIGWVISLVVIVFIFITAVVVFCLERGTFLERMRAITTPTNEWGPALVKHRRKVKHLPGFVVDPWGNEEMPVDQGDIKVHMGHSNLGFD